MTDRQVALKLTDIRNQLLALEKEMLEGGYHKETIGIDTMIDLSDTISDAILEFAQSGDCVEEFLPEE